MRGLIEEFNFHFRAIRALFFPRRCLVCGAILEDFEDYLCIKCFSKMPLTYFWGWRNNSMEQMLWKNVGISSAFSLFFYQDTNNYSLLTQRVKYDGWLGLGRAMGDCLAKLYVESNGDNVFDAIVPVPLHWIRLWSRGYNQAEIIGQGVASVMKIPVLNLLVRTRRTQTQTILTKEEKSANVFGAFSVHRKRVKGAKKQGIKHVLLIDDVCTTGATLSACAAPLLEHFEVSIATIAFVGEL